MERIPDPRFRYFHFPICRSFVRSLVGSIYPFNDLSVHASIEIQGSRSVRMLVSSSD